MEKMEKQNDVISLEDISDEGGINIDFFSENESQEIEDLDIDMILGSDIEEISLVDESLMKMEMNNDNHLKLAAMIGLDLSSGKVSKGLDKDLTNILIDLEVEEEDDGDEDGQAIEVSKEFDDNEKRRYKDMLVGIFAFHKDRQLVENFKDFHKQLQENNQNKNAHFVEKRKVEAEINPEIETFKRLDVINNMYNKYDNKVPLTKKEKDILMSLDRAEVKMTIKQKRKTIKNLGERLDQLNKSIEICDEVEKEILDSIEKLRKFRETSSIGEIEKNVEKIISKTKKIVQVQYGISLYSSEFKELPIAVRCACGHKEVFDVSRLPYYLSGNIYDNYKERSYINKNVKKNLYTNRDTIKSNETRTKLERESNMLESRINFPGLNGEGEPLMCTSCGSYLLFTPDTIDRLAERGFLLDTFTAELAGTNKGKELDLTQGVKVYLNSTEIESKYLADLGLSEYKISKISSNIRDIDKTATEAKLGNKNRIDENSLRIYAGRPTGELNLKQIEDEFIGHVKNINMAIDDLIKHYRVPKQKNGMSGPALVKYENKKRRNEGINRFLRNSRSIILKYAIDTRVSSQGLKSLVQKHENNIGEFKNKILEFLVEYLIDSVIQGRPSFVFEEGYARTIENNRMVLPHTNFFDCYKPLIKNYFLFGELSQVKKDFQLSEYYNLFRSLSNISKIEDYKTRVKKSEEFVKKFRDKLGEDYEKNKSKFFFDYMKDTIKFESNLDSSGRCFGWLYYEMITQDKMIKQLEVQDQELFDKLYGDELREKGHFYIFQADKNLI